MGIKLLEGKAEPYTNIALVHHCRALLRQCSSSVPGTTVLFHHISSHTRNFWNDRADKLANLGSTRRTRLGRYASPPTTTTVDPLTQLTHLLSTVQLEAPSSPSWNDESGTTTNDTAVESNAVPTIESDAPAILNPSPN